MPGRAISQIRRLLQQGQDALERRESLQAELCFSRAIGLAEDFDDLEARRDAYSAAGVVLVRSPFANLAGQVAREALALDRQLGKPAGYLIGDMLSYGSALGHLNRHSEAVEVFQQLLDLCLAERRYADAASASTNLGACLVHLGDMKKARKSFEDSLEYLRQQSFPETELMTRINLLSLNEHMKEDPKASLELARETLDRFSEVLPVKFRALIDEHIDRGAVRYLRSNTPEAKRWLHERFPDVEVAARTAKKGT